MTVLTRRSDSGVTVLCAAGELDVAAAQELLPTLPDLVAGASGVVLDLTDVTFFDSSGCRLVDRLAHECGRVCAPFRVVAPPGSSSRQVLRIVGMVDGLTCDSVPEATAVVRG